MEARAVSLHLNDPQALAECVEELHELFFVKKKPFHRRASEAYLLLGCCGNLLVRMSISSNDSRRSLVIARFTCACRGDRVGEEKCLRLKRHISNMALDFEDELRDLFAQHEIVLFIH